MPTPTSVLFIRRKIDESKNEIRQLENTFNSFPMLRGQSSSKGVIKNITNHKDSLAHMGKLKLKS